MEAPLTRLQVRIRDVREAAMAAAAGFDCVEVAIGEGAETDLANVRDIRRAFHGTVRLTFSGTGRPLDRFGEIDADPTASVEIALPIHASALEDDVADVRLVALVKPSDGVAGISDLGTKVRAVMFEAVAPGRLIDQSPIAALDAFATACRARGLPFGLGGGLEAPDVARLLVLEPDLLAFDTGVRHNHVPEGQLDAGALDAVRALVPHRKTQPTKKIAKVTDRIFLRDFEVSLAIGAYKAEHGKRQRVRFSIVADVVRAAGVPHDMRDVFSYDIMIETIRVLSERPHVTFVETLAEEVAASILTHTEVVSVTVTVEKLDVVNGSVGIEITRCRDAS